MQWCSGTSSGVRSGVSESTSQIETTRYPDLPVGTLKRYVADGNGTLYLVPTPTSERPLLTGIPSGMFHIFSEILVFF